MTRTEEQKLNKKNAQVFNTFWKSLTKKQREHIRLEYMSHYNKGPGTATHSIDNYRSGGTELSGENKQFFFKQIIQFKEITFKELFPNHQEIKIPEIN